jgi:MFS family permease
MVDGSARRDWRVFLVARAVSLTGSALTALAIPVVLFERTGSPFLTGLASSVPALVYVLFSMVSGYVADTRDRKSVLYGCDFFSVAAMLAMIAILQADTAVQLILVPLFLLDAASVFFDSSGAGVAPALVDEAAVPRAVARLSAMSTLIETAAPAIGGVLLVLLSASGLLSLDAVSFLVSGLLLLSLRTPLSRHLADGAQHPTDRLRFALGGARFVRESPLLLATTLCLSAQSLFVAAFMGQLAPLVAERTATLSTGVGVVLGVLAAGAFVGTLLVPRLLARYAPPRILVGTTVLIVISASTILAVRSFPVLLVAVAVMAVGMAVSVVMLATLRVQLAPADTVGRVVAFGRLVSWAVPGLIGGIVGGALAAATTPELGVAALGVPYLLVAAVCLTRLARLTRAEASSGQARGDGGEDG